MQVLLLQIRGDRPAEQQERLCFLEATGLREEELISINLVDRPVIEWSEVSRFDALFVGGAGGHTATSRYDFTPYLDNVILRAIDADLPYFGSCFGHHALVKALGGDVVTDHHAGEVGTFDVALTNLGRTDELLRGFPSRFAAQLGHHDRIDSLPAGMVELAFSARCRHQMLRLEHRSVYSTQFHSELSREHLAARLEMYRDTYLSERATAEEISRTLRPSPWSDRLLARFVQMIGR